tara:strand:- start:84 stop:326 length:243 start_codon:yes stop_codon:yes gene_type:complete
MALQFQFEKRYDRLVTTLLNNSDKSSKSASVVRDGGTRLLGVEINNGGAEEARTPDLFNAIEALSQLSYSPTVWCVGIIH